jgi:hypothetical protein
MNFDMFSVTIDLSEIIEDRFFGVWLLWLIEMSLRSFYVIASINGLLFLLLTIISLSKYSRKYLFIHLIVDIWVIFSLTIVNRAVMFLNWLFSGCMFWANFLKWSKSMGIFSFMRTCQRVLQSGLKMHTLTSNEENSTCSISVQHFCGDFFKNHVIRCNACVTVRPGY